MSQLPAVSGKQLIKILEGRGWYVKRIRGSHHILRHPTHSGCASGAGAWEHDAQAGTLGNILRTAGISREEFQQLSNGLADAARPKRRVRSANEQRQGRR